MEKLILDFTINNIMETPAGFHVNAGEGNGCIINLFFKEKPTLKLGDKINGIFRQRISIEDYYKDIDGKQI